MHDSMYRQAGDMYGDGFFDDAKSFAKKAAKAVRAGAVGPRTEPQPWFLRTGPTFLSCTISLSRTWVVARGGGDVAGCLSALSLPESSRRGAAARLGRRAPRGEAPAAVWTEQPPGAT